VHSFLAMQTIGMLGSEEQKRRWLPAMARLEKIGAFALTEADHGSDSVGLETTARRKGDHYRLNGRQKWIGNASFADHVIVWASAHHVARHFADMEAVFTFEGTDSIQSLIVGREITGIQAISAGGKPG
jgi:alkylation response protein AidB-like acyl-CoA dehydrogenase